jgi:hypothetical protein
MAVRRVITAAAQSENASLLFNPYHNKHDNPIVAITIQTVPEETVNQGGWR